MILHFLLVLQKIQLQQKLIHFQKHLKLYYQLIDMELHCYYQQQLNWTPYPPYPHFVLLLLSRYPYHQDLNHDLHQVQLQLSLQACLLNLHLIQLLQSLDLDLQRHFHNQLLSHYYFDFQHQRLSRLLQRNRLGYRIQPHHLLIYD